jgi:hypothetical protein
MVKMTGKAVFEGLVFDENDNVLDTTYVAASPACGSMTQFYAPHPLPSK